jgi:hypothetical protein
LTYHLKGFPVTLIIKGFLFTSVSHNRLRSDFPPRRLRYLHGNDQFPLSAPPTICSEPGFDLTPVLYGCLRSTLPLYTHSPSENASEMCSQTGASVVGASAEGQIVFIVDETREGAD